MMSKFDLFHQTMSLFHKSWFKIQNDLNLYNVQRKNLDNNCLESFYFKTSKETRKGTQRSYLSIGFQKTLNTTPYSVFYQSKVKIIYKATASTHPSLKQIYKHTSDQSFLGQNKLTQRMYPLNQKEYSFWISLLIINLNQNIIKTQIQPDKLLSIISKETYFYVHRYKSNNLYIFIFFTMNFFRSCVEASKIICSSFDENAILTGVSDTIIVKQKDGTYKSTPFLVCFGPYLATHQFHNVQIVVNGTLINDVKFSLDFKGYIHPQHLSDKEVRKLHLNFGVNKVVYQLEGYKIEAEIYLYANNDKLVVSDVDGTVTKNDVGGHINNFVERDYLHEGYAQLSKKIDKNGYKIVWLTMRALPLYNYSKKYLRQTVGVDGPILMQPQQLMRALSKQLLKKTGNIKANMMMLMHNLFTSNPFMAGLGNRQNDAVAYLHAGVPLQKIFIVDTQSRVQIMSEGKSLISYIQMAQNIEKYFPTYSAPKVGYL